MMKFPFALCLLLAGLSSYAAPLQPDWLIIISSGRDADGLSLFDRFEITPDGLAKWQTSSTGLLTVACADAGGRFSGKVTGDQAKKATALAESALSSQSERQENPSSSREAGIQLMVGRAGEAKSGVILEATPEWKQLLEEIRELRRALNPESLVVLKARKQKGNLRVEFELLGEKPMTLLLPETADEAFYADKGKARYLRKPKKLEIELSKSSPTYSLVLNGIAEGAKEIRYSNAVILHHEEEKNSELKIRQELSLCTEI